MRKTTFRKAVPFLILGALVVFIASSFSWGVGRVSSRTEGAGALQGKDELLKANQAKQWAAIRSIMAQIQPSTEELAALKKLEKKASAAEYEKAVARLDRKYEVMTLDRITGIDKKWINPKPSIMRDVLGQAKISYQKAPSTFGDLMGLLTDGSVACDCVIPFTFQGLEILGNITGPATTDVRCGVIGAGREADGEYTLTNLGDTEGKGRVPLDGYLSVVFGAEIPEAGSYVLLMPSGLFLVTGSTRVKGHGNMTTCYDSKVSVQMVQSLYAGDQCLEYTGPWDIQSDGTRSEDRTKSFVKDIQYDPRYMKFNAGGPCYLSMYFWLLAHTECNEDGKAWVIVDLFGFPANTKSDYDTLLIKSQ